MNDGSKLSALEMIKIIYGEVFNGCHDERDTYEYFVDNYSGVDLKVVRSVAASINYAGMRETIINDEVYAKLF